MNTSMIRLRALREEKELKQSDVMNATGISRSSLSQYENGMRPPLDACIQLAKFYDVSLEYLLGLANERKPAGGQLDAAFSELSKLAGDAALTAGELATALEAAALYYRKGAPCGEQPINAWRDFTHHLADCFYAAAKYDSVALIDSTNAATLAALEIAKMPAIYYKNQKEDGTK